MIKAASCQFAATLTAVVLLASSPAWAQTAPAAESLPVTQEGPNLHFDALGHRFTVPMPDWLSAAERLSPDVLALIESGSYADERQAFVEFFPKGQSLEDWQITFAARITLEPDRSLEDYRRASMVGLSQACKPEATGFFLFGEETPDFFPALGFVCGAYRDDIDKLRGQGEIMVSVFRKSDAGIAMVYQEWKGPAFDPSDPSTWPATAETIQLRADQLQADATLLVRDAD
jgi:hypothetical protein